MKSWLAGAIALLGVAGCRLDGKRSRRKRKQGQDLTDLLFAGDDLFENDGPPGGDDASLSWAEEASDAPWAAWDSDAWREDSACRTTGVGHDRAVTVVNLARRANSVAFTPSAAKPLTRRKARAGAVNARPRHLGRWWLAGCLSLAALLLGGANFGSASAPSRRETGVASRRPASKSIETICVGQRVVTQDAGNWPARHAAPPSTRQTWKKLVLLAETHWARRHARRHQRRNAPTARVDQAARRSHRRDRPACRSIWSRWACRATLTRRSIAVEHCPEISDGPGRVVLTHGQPPEQVRLRANDQGRRWPQRNCPHHRLP